MILESIVTTLNNDASVNISPMGPRILDAAADGSFEKFELRPFDTSTTFANLKLTQAGVMHVDDNVDLFARAAIGKITGNGLPKLTAAEVVDGQVIESACRAYEFKVNFIDETGPRMSLNCEVVAVHRQRDFFGFNRAKHAVIEAAILATRLDFLPSQEIAALMKRLQTIVDKTAGEQETQAMMLLAKFIQSHAREQ
jgi:hypothetical protein